MSAKVSIIVPVYNVENYLDRCIQSIINQTYQNIEIILVDDGSPDNCPKMCDSYAERYSTVKVIHKNNGGLSSARLAGFKESTGKYILFIDSDDYISEKMVKKLVTPLEETNSDLSICSYYTDKNGMIDEHTFNCNSSRIVGKENILNSYILPLVGEKEGTSSIPGFLCIRMMKRSLISEDFFKSERIYFKEDHVFDLLYGDRINSICIVNEPLYYYYFNKSSLSNVYRKNKWKMYINLYNFYTSYLNERGLHAHDRLKNSLSSSIFASVDNAVLLNTYSEFKKEILELYSFPEAANIIKQYKNTTSITRKVTLFLLDKHLLRVLYWVRKKRISQSKG